MFGTQPSSFELSRSQILLCKEGKGVLNKMKYEEGKKVEMEIKKLAEKAISYLWERFPLLLKEDLGISRYSIGNHL